MKSKRIFVAVALMLIMINMLAFASAEITLRGYNKVTGTNTTKMSIMMSVDDTSDVVMLKQNSINVTVTALHNTAYTPIGTNNLSLVACSVQEIHTINEYNADGNLVNSTVDIKYTDINVSSSGSGSIFYASLKQKDTYEVNYICIWDGAVDDTIFQNYLDDTALNYQACSLDVGFPSWTCKACNRQDYEQTVTEYIEARSQAQDYLLVFNNIMSLSLNDIELWYMAYWIIKIILWIILVMLVFMAGIWLYHFFRDIARNV